MKRIDEYQNIRWVEGQLYSLWSCARLRKSVVRSTSYRLYDVRTTIDHRRIKNLVVALVLVRLSTWYRILSITIFQEGNSGYIAHVA